MRLHTTVSLALLVFIAFAAPCFGQTKSSTDPAERPQESTQKLKYVTWTPACKDCDSIYVDGDLYRGITVDGLTVGASVKDTGTYLKAHVLVSNKTQKRLTVRPELFKLFVTVPKEREVAYITPERVARRLMLGAEIENGAELGVAIATAQNTQTTSQSTTAGSVSAHGSGGFASGTYQETTTTTTTTTPNQQHIQAQLQANAQRRRSSANVTADTVIKNSLKTNTLMSGNEIDGWTYFQREKKAEGIVLMVILDDLIFELPFHFDKKKK